MADVDAMIMSNLDAITGDDGGLLPLPDDDGSSEPETNAEPARLVDPGEAKDGGDADGGDDDLAASADESAPEPKKAQGEESDDEPAAESSYGSEEDPFTLSDIPDEYVRVKVDGEEKVISLKQAAESFTKQAAVDQRLAKAKTVIEEAERAREAADERIARYEQGLMATFGDSERLMMHLEQHHPDVLDELTLRHYPKLYEAHRKGGLDAFRAQRQLSHRERMLQRQQEAMLEQQRRQQAEQQRAQRISVVGPAIKEAIAKTGFGRLTDDVRQRIGAALDVEQRRLGRDLSPEEITEVAATWMRVYGEKPEAVERRVRKPRHRKAPDPVQGNPEASRSRRKAPAKYDSLGNLSADWILSQAGG